MTDKFQRFAADYATTASCVATFIIDFQAVLCSGGLGPQTWTKQPTSGSIQEVLIPDCRGGVGSGFGKFLENDLPNGEKSYISDDLIHLLTNDL